MSEDKDMLKARRIAFVPTVNCTLNCRLCCNFMPFFKQKYNVDIEALKKDIDATFEIFDYVEWIQFVGGEVFMHPQMSEIYEYLLCHKEKFSKLILMTNATIVPREQEVVALKKYKGHCKIMISDYGKYSYKKKEMVDICERESIPYIVKNYAGDDQYCEGWIDNTKLTPFKGNEAELKEAFLKCPQVKMQNVHCLDGKMHLCSNSCFLSALGKSVPSSRDFIDLRDTDVSREQKREIFRSFYEQPSEACKICSFKDIGNAERFQAAEQL